MTAALHRRRRLARRASPLWSLGLLWWALAAPTAGCDGYGELPVPHREDATLDVEATSLRAGAVGLVQVIARLPSDAASPLVVVGSPVAEAGSGASAAGGDEVPVVQGWAWGSCAGLSGPEEAPHPNELRLCVAVWTPSSAPFSLALVAEARGAARRFTARGEVAR